MGKRDMYIGLAFVGKIQFTSNSRTYIYIYIYFLRKSSRRFFPIDSIALHFRYFYIHSTTEEHSAIMQKTIVLLTNLLSRENNESVVNLL